MQDPTGGDIELYDCGEVPQAKGEIKMRDGTVLSSDSCDPCFNVNSLRAVFYNCAGGMMLTRNGWPFIRRLPEAVPWP